MNKSVRRRRVANLWKKVADLPDVKCDAVWIIQPENRRYLSGYKAEDTHFTESSGSLLVNNDRCFLLTDSRYTLEAEKEAQGFEIETLKQGLVEGFTELVARLGPNRVGFEEDYVTWGVYQELSEKLAALKKPVKLVPLKGVVQEMREVKDAAEVRALEAAADTMSAILDEVIEWLKPGLTEKEVAWRIETLARESSADRLAFPSIVASGSNSALPHAQPTDKKLHKGEPITLDVGVRLNGYCSDMTRTVFLGRPKSKLRKIYKTVREAQLASLAEVRVGVESSLPDSVARKIIRDAGFGEFFGHALGHGVGLATHEGPRLGPRKPVILKKGMVVTVEPGIYVPGDGGVRLEEMVLIERSGPRVLTKNDHFYEF